MRFDLLPRAEGLNGSCVTERETEKTEKINERDRRRMKKEEKKEGFGQGCLSIFLAQLPGNRGNHPTG